MPKTITITAATGKVGRAAAEYLKDKDVHLRAVARNADKLVQLKQMGAEVFPGNLQDTDFLVRTFLGSDAVLVIVPDNVQEQDFKGYKSKLARSIVSAIEKSGVSYVVAVSSIGTDLAAPTGPLEALHIMEQQLKSIMGINAVILRCAFFMDNLLSSIPVIKSAGINGGAYSREIRMPMIASSDIARTAAAYLSALDFSGYKIRDLLGSGDYTFPEVTSAIGKAIGRPDLQYVQFPFNETKKALMQSGFSSAAADAILESVTVLNEGKIQATVKRTKENTTPTTIEQFAETVFNREYYAQYSTGVMT